MSSIVLTHKAPVIKKFRRPREQPQESEEDGGEPSLTVHLKGSRHSLCNTHTFPFRASQQLAQVRFTNEKMDCQNDVQLEVLRLTLADLG